MITILFDGARGYCSETSNHRMSTLDGSLELVLRKNIFCPPSQSTLGPHHSPTTFYISTLYSVFSTELITIWNNLLICFLVGYLIFLAGTWTPWNRELTCCSGGFWVLFSLVIFINRTLIVRGSDNTFSLLSPVSYTHLRAHETS